MSTKPKAADRAPIAEADPAIFADPEVQRLLRPKLLAALGVTPIVDAATGEVAVPVAALAAALGLSESEMLEQVGPNGAKHVDIARIPLLAIVLISHASHRFPLLTVPTS
jgi:hypothetical protein